MYFKRNVRVSPTRSLGSRSRCGIGLIVIMVLRDLSGVLAPVDAIGAAARAFVEDVDDLDPDRLRPGIAMGREELAPIAHQLGVSSPLVAHTSSLPKRSDIAY